MAHRMEGNTRYMTSSRIRFRPKSAAKAVTLALGLFLAASPLQAQDTSLPSIGGAGGGLISGQQESEIGEQVMV